MIYISLGSNIGNRIHNLQKAVRLIQKYCLKNLKYSIILETQAILPKHSPTSWNKPFLNMIVLGETTLSPDMLLIELKKIEIQMGRISNQPKWAPRMIDLDILLFNDLHINSTNLIIPHPELKNRNFLQHLLALMEVTPWNFNNNIYESFSNSFSLKPEIVGIVNITNDSFSDGGKYVDIDKATKQIYKLSHQGASIIEIGAQSTRPNAIIQNPNEEYNKLCLILDEIAPLINNQTIHISIDTFWPAIAVKLLKKYHIRWINDVKGDYDNENLNIIAAANCGFCFMHSITVPPTREHIINPIESPINVLMAWAEKYITRLLKLGFDLNNIILDPGVGFGKSLYHNLEILRYIHKLQQLGIKIMIGHSRKSFIKAFSPILNPEERDIETLSLSIALKNKVDFLRVHNVEFNMRALVANEILQTN